MLKDHRHSTVNLIRPSFSSCSDHFTADISTPVPKGLLRADVIRGVQDPSLVIQLQPLITRYEKKFSEGTETFYEISENVALLPYDLWMWEIISTVSLQDTDDGVISKTQAPLRVSLRMRMSVKQLGDMSVDDRASLQSPTDDDDTLDDTQLVLHEHAELSAPTFFKHLVHMNFINGLKELYKKLLLELSEKNLVAEI